MQIYETNGCILLIDSYYTTTQRIIESRHVEIRDWIAVESRTIKRVAIKMIKTDEVAQ